MRIAIGVALLGFLTAPAAAQVAVTPEPFQAIEAGEMEDTEVESLAGEDLGEVERIVRGPGGEIFAVLEFGGVAGIGESRRLVPVAQLAWRDDELVYPGASRAQLPELLPWRSGMTGFTDIDDDEPIRISRYPG